MLLNIIVNNPIKNRQKPLKIVSTPNHQDQLLFLAVFKFVGYKPP